jgi:acetamidase/formamidase
MAHHDFRPETYYKTLGPHRPVLEIASGDTVSTPTMDAGGRDANNKQITPPGNPMSGPFSVTGAEPGDTLVVTFESITPSRRMGITSPKIAPAILDPGHPVTHAEGLGMCRWELNEALTTATMVEPETPLAKVPLPLSPMIGCFGVAPAGGQAISTVTSGPHGGNMDYRFFTAGASVHFPVSEPGGLFFLGDGHALQGDGEIVGTGIEISMTVRFRLDLIKNQKIEWPRAENDTYIMTVGNARPLDQCVQHATSEMLRWLENGYGLDPLVAHSILGQCVEYDMGNVFDPAYTMVCKIKKSVLRELGVLR